MSERKPYWEMLRDGRWQETRLRVMERDSFTCRHCYKKGDEGAFLNVHHKVYRKGAKPWEYDLADLITLCEDCHEVDHEWRQHLLEAVAKLDQYDLQMLVGMAEAMVAANKVQGYLQINRPNELREGWESVFFPVRSDLHAIGFIDVLMRSSAVDKHFTKVFAAGRLTFMEVFDRSWLRE